MFREFAPRQQGERGRTMRGDLVKTSLRARLSAGEGGGALHIVMILASGFVAETPVPLAPGTRIGLSLPPLGEVAAQVHWTMGERTGFRFERPLTLDELKRLA